MEKQKMCESKAKIINNFIYGQNACACGCRTFCYLGTQELVIDGKLAAINLPSAVLINASIKHSDAMFLTCLIENHADVKIKKDCRLVQVNRKPTF